MTTKSFILELRVHKQGGWSPLGQKEYRRAGDAYKNLPKVALSYENDYDWRVIRNEINVTRPSHFVSAAQVAKWRHYNKCNPDPEYVSIEVGNDWGVVYYAYAGQSLTCDGFADRKLGLKLREGHAMQVMFPDGTTSTSRLSARKQYSTVSDHGKHSDVAYTEYGFEGSYLGVPVWIPLEAVKVLKGSISSGKE